MRKILTENSIYLKKFFTNPIKLGSIAPTSTISANFLAKHIKTDGYVVELGAGTGSLTKAILNAGVSPDKLICIELDASFCQMLKNKFPGVTVLCADARQVEMLLDDAILQNISSVVSAIPLLPMPKKLRYEIVSAAIKILRADGRFIQVSYSPFSPVPWKELNLKQQRYGTIFKNIPPISIFGYEK